MGSRKVAKPRRHPASRNSVQTDAVFGIGPGAQKGARNRRQERMALSLPRFLPNAAAGVPGPIGLAFGAVAHLQAEVERQVVLRRHAAFAPGELVGELA